MKNKLALDKAHTHTKKVKQMMKRENKKLKKAITKGNTKKDPGLPNINPFKKKLLEELKRKKPTEDRQRQIQMLEEAEAKKQPNVSDIVAQAQSRQMTYSEPLDAEKSRTYVDNSMKSYYKDLIHVLESADIILEVLDARDPLGCRSEELENKVLSYGHKKIIIVLNKIDLVPGEVALGWLNYLSQHLPVVLFRSNIQQQQTRLGSTSSFNTNNISSQTTRDMLDSTKTVGTEALMGLIKNYMRSGNVMTAVTIGVVGYPNVGKSSLINSMKRSKAVGVSSTPGFTTGVQEVEIESKIKILDSPGVVFSKTEGRGSPEMVLRNVVKIESLDDPITPVQAILSKVTAENLMSHYEIPEYREGIEFLAHIARKRGKMKKGGIPDLDAAAKIVLHDWVDGKIAYYTLPPQSTNMTMG